MERQTNVGVPLPFVVETGGGGVKEDVTLAVEDSELEDDRVVDRDDEEDVDINGSFLSWWFKNKGDQ